MINPFCMETICHLTAKNWMDMNSTPNPRGSESSHFSLFEWIFQGIIYSRNLLIRLGVWKYSFVARGTVLLLRVMFFLVRPLSKEICQWKVSFWRYKYFLTVNFSAGNSLPEAAVLMIVHEGQQVVWFS